MWNNVIFEGQWTLKIRVKRHRVVIWSCILTDFTGELSDETWTSSRLRQIEIWNDKYSFILQKQIRANYDWP